ncbi:hypothetical protein QUB05_04760 [Microcoleus sp. F10-C6]|jgi:DNA mismatch repair ATPase MutS|uniref:hypothetical protein n=1 Tax=unclassified Microcoleus TaxID=2642155 RepID=UPI002FD0FA2F
MDNPVLVQNPYLKRIAEIRNQIAILQAEAEAIEPDALIEGFDVLEQKQSKKQIVHNDENAKIIIQFRSQYDDKITTIVRLDEDIAREYDNLCRSNATAIEHCKALIAELQGKLEEAETKLETFLSSPHLENLKRQRAIELKNTENKVAKLAVYVKFMKS